MTSQKIPANKNIAGNGLLVGLLIVALVGAAVAAWLYVGKGNVNLSSLPEISNQTPAQDPSTATPPPANEAAAPVVAPTAENTVTPPAPTEIAPPTTPEPTAPVAPLAATTAPAVKIDVAKAMDVRSLGDIKAPVKIIEYFSLTCGHCAHFHNDILPELKTKYIDTGKVYIEFREFPLNDPALQASLTARCLPADKYEGFISLLFKTQDHWAAGLEYVAALKQNAKLAGMSDETFDACQAEPQLKMKIAEGMEVAKNKWKIDATPTFVINDGAEKIDGAQPLEEFERIFRKVTNNAVGAAPAVK